MSTQKALLERQFFSAYPGVRQARTLSPTDQRITEEVAEVSEISTRIWMDERLWDQLRTRAEVEGMTVRELIPLLVRQAFALAGPRSDVGQAAAPAPAAPAPVPTAEPTIPVVGISETYQCAVCGAQIRLGGLSNHLARHLKEMQASESASG